MLKNDIEKYNSLETQKEKLIDIYRFHFVLYKLFEDLDLLSEDIEDGTRFSFIEGRPSQLYDGKQTVVSLEIGERKYSERHSTVASNPRSQVRSGYKGSLRNPVTGQIEDCFVDFYTSEVLITIHSEHYSHLITVVKLIESILNKHRGLLEDRVSKCLYKGTTRVNYYTNSAGTLLQSKTIILQVETQEVYTLVKEELQNINNNT